MGRIITLEGLASCGCGCGGNPSRCAYGNGFDGSPQGSPYGEASNYARGQQTAPVIVNVNSGSQDQTSTFGVTATRTDSRSDGGRQSYSTQTIPGAPGQPPQTVMVPTTTPATPWVPMGTTPATRQTVAGTPVPTPEPHKRWAEFY